FASAIFFSSFLFFFYYSGAPRYLHSFPTRRSSDLGVRPPIASRSTTLAPPGIRETRATSAASPDSCPVTTTVSICACECSVSAPDAAEPKAPRAASVQGEMKCLIVVHPREKLRKRHARPRRESADRSGRAGIVSDGLDARRSAGEISFGELADDERHALVERDGLGLRRLRERRVRGDEGERERGAYGAAVPALVRGALIFPRRVMVAARVRSVVGVVTDIGRRVLLVRRGRFDGTRILEERERRAGLSAMTEPDGPAVGKRRRHEPGRHERTAQEADQSEPEQNAPHAEDAAIAWPNRKPEAHCSGERPGAASPTAERRGAEIGRPTRARRPAARRDGLRRRFGGDASLSKENVVLPLQQI